MNKDVLKARLLHSAVRAAFDAIVPARATDMFLYEEKQAKAVAALQDLKDAIESGNVELARKVYLK